MATQIELRAQVESVNNDKFPFRPHLRRTAQAMIEQSVKVKEGHKVLIWYEDPTLPLAYEVLAEVERVGAQAQFFRRDLVYDAQVFRETAIGSPAEAGLDSYFTRERELVENSDAIIRLQARQDASMVRNLPMKRRQLYDQGMNGVLPSRIAGTRPWVLFYWPTEYEADIEGIPHPQYFAEIMEASNQPWQEIREAQGHLISSILNPADTLTIIASKEDPSELTNVTMSIKGMTFANSTIIHNFPGSEVFSAPIIDSVQGTIVAPDQHTYRGATMGKIHLVIEDGLVLDRSFAEENDEALQEILVAAGMRHFGEIGFGTNPGMSRIYRSNVMYKEKAAGTAHLALGSAYQDKIYDREPVSIDNGNRSDHHWDIPFSMRQGIIMVDGRVIQEDGRFLDPKLAILNPL